MSYIIVGLGNPGEEYEHTRHNTGRVALQRFQKNKKFPEWEYSKKLNAETSEGKLRKEKVLLVLPETFMNKSGGSVKSLVKSEKAASRVIVVHDDLDLPLGAFKIVFNRGAGGHKGVESITRAIKTRSFIRLRIGISPQTPSGKLKKPKGARAVNDFILGEFKPKERDVIKRVAGKVSDALNAIVFEGLERAMNAHN